MSENSGFTALSAQQFNARPGKANKDPSLFRIQSPLKISCPFNGSHFNKSEPSKLQYMRSCSNGITNQEKKIKDF